MSLVGVQTFSDRQGRAGRRRTDRLGAMRDRHSPHRSTRSWPPSPTRWCTAARVAVSSPSCRTFAPESTSPTWESPNSSTHRPARRRSAGPIEEAALAGGASIIYGGIDPGFTTQLLPFVLAAVSERVDLLTLYEVRDYDPLPLWRLNDLGLGVMDTEAAGSTGPASSTTPGDPRSGASPTPWVAPTSR